MGVKYVCKNVTRKHNFLAPIIFLIEKLDLSFKSTDEKSMRKWVRIWFIVDTGDLIVFKCYNLFSSQAQWSILKYMKVALTHGLFYNFIVSLLIIKNNIISIKRFGNENNKNLRIDFILQRCSIMAICHHRNIILLQ